MEGLEFLKEVSVWQLLLFILAVDKVFGWIKTKYKEGYKNTAQKEEHERKISELENSVSEIKNLVSELTTSIEISNESNRNQIKTTIVKEYNYFTRQGWIDNYSLDCIERLYDSYRKLNGNSYIKDLMVKIRELPNQEPLI